MHLSRTSHAVVAFFVSLALISQELTARASTPDLAGSSCQSFLESVGSASASQWDPQRNLFSETVSSMIASNVVWLSIVEGIRQAGKADPALAATYLRTVPIDTLISSISHMLGLGHFPLLTRILEANDFSPRTEFWVRTGTNGIFNAAIISVGWALLGIDVGGKEVAGAFALCAGVYPVLIGLKRYLFRVFPLAKDCSTKACLVQEFQEKVTPIFDLARERAQQLNLTPERREALLLSALESILTSRPYEQEIVKSPILSGLTEVQTVLKELEALKAAYEKQDVLYHQNRIARKIMRVRRALLDLILKHERLSRSTPLHDEIVRILDLGAPLGPQDSIRFHRMFSERYGSYRKRIWVASFLDQAVAVGIAGGIFLYNTTYWAEHGHWSWQEK